MKNFFRKTFGLISSGLATFAFIIGSTSVANAQSNRAASVSAADINAPTVGVTPGRGAPTDIGGLNVDPRLYSDPRTNGGFGPDSSVDERGNVRTDKRFGSSKNGVALFTTNAGNLEIAFKYSGRFQGKFEDHTAGFRLTLKIPPF